MLLLPKHPIVVSAAIPDPVTRGRGRVAGQMLSGGATNTWSLFAGLITWVVRGVVLGALLATQAPQTALALSATWTGAANAFWSSAGNWSASPVPGSGDTATLNSVGGAVDTISLAGVTIKTILFDTTNAAAYTLGAGVVNSETLTLDNGGAIALNATVANNQWVNAAILLGTDGSAQSFSLTNNTAAKTLTCAGSITGSTGAGLKVLAVGGSGATLLSGVIANGTSGMVKLSKSNPGTLMLANPANTFTGGIVIGANSGTVTAVTTNGSNKTGLGAGGVSIGSGSTLRLASVNAIAALTAINNAFTGTGTLELTFSETAAATYTVLGSISGFAGTIRLSNTTPSHKDKWYGNNLGAINASLVIDNASQIFVANGPASFSSISVTGTGNAEGYGAIRLGNTLGGDITLAGNATIGLGGGTITGNISSGASGTQKLTLGTTAAASSGTFTGSIGGGTGVIAVTVASGTTTLSNANTYAGNTLISGGTLKLGHNLALQNSVLDMSGAGRLAFVSGINTPTLGGLSGSSPLTLPANVTALTLRPGTGVTVTYAGALGSVAAGLSLIKTGAGTQVLSGSNTFTGPTLVSQGTLRIAPGALPSLPAGLKIMPLGDSITHGSGSDANYRYYLNGLLTPVAPGFQFVGESTENPGTLPVSPIDQRHHCGHSSYSCNDINHNLDGLDTATFVLYGGATRDPHGGYWLTGGNGTGRAPIYPDAILLLAAANDISRVGMTGVQGRIEALLTKMTTLRPAARIFLAKASPYAGYDTSVATFNNILGTVATNFQAAGKQITVVDLNTGYPAGQFVDAVHPNATGYNWMANRWYDALVSVYGFYPPGQTSRALAASASATVAVGARLEGAGAIGGPLTIAGTLAPGTGTLSVGATEISGTLECAWDSVDCGNLNITGYLTLTNATLALTPLVATSRSSYRIASYTGTLQGAFSTVTGLPTGYVVYYDTAAKRILIATHYEAWRLARGLGDTQCAMTFDPDGDGVPNLAEYALGGNPLDAGDRGVYAGRMTGAASPSKLALTIGTRSGAIFTPVGGRAMTASVDGVSYLVEGSQDLSTWPEAITELNPAQTEGLPAVPGGYEYHTFQGGNPGPGVTRGFLRLTLTAAP